MRTLLVSIIAFMAAFIPVHALAADQGTCETTFFLYNIVDTKDQHAADIVKKLQDADPKFSVNDSEARADMFPKPVSPVPGDRLFVISDEGVRIDTVKSLKFNEVESCGYTYLMFYTKKYPENKSSDLGEGDIIFALKNDMAANSKSAPRLTSSIRATKKEKSEALEKILAYISDPANKETIFSLSYGFDDEKEPAENLSNKYKSRCFRLKKASERSDILIYCLEARSEEKGYDNFMFVFDRGKIVFADYADYKFSFNNDGLDFFMTKQWKPGSGCIGLVLYAIINGRLEQVVSDYSFAD